MWRSKRSDAKNSQPSSESPPTHSLHPSDTNPDASPLPTADFVPPTHDAHRVDLLERSVADGVKQIDEYTITGEIARGGMGIVYKAWDNSLKCHVALKTIRAGEFADQHHVERFRREAEATAKLQHPHIVRIHRVGQVAGLHYFTMDYVTGPTLGQMIRERSLPQNEIVRLTLEICDAIAYAHRQGILHRDLKPSNVLTDEDGRALVTDFGLAKRIEDDSDFSRTGQAIGTPGYMPPEQATGKRNAVGVRSDVYAIGALLFHLLTGKPPFSGDSYHDVINQVLNVEVSSARKFNPSINRDLDTICIKCMRKSPDQRYSSVLELMSDLERFSKGFPIQARPVSMIQRGWSWCRRNPAVATMLAVTLLTISLATATFVYRGKQVQTNVSARLDSAWQRLEAEMKSIALTDQSSHDALMSSRVGLDADKLRAALSEYEDAQSTWTRFRGDVPTTEDRRFEIARASYRVAQASRLLGDLPRSEAAFQDAIERFTELVAQSPDRADFNVELGEAYNYMGELYRDHDLPEKALNAYSQSLSLLRANHARFPHDVATQIELARIENNFGLSLEDTGEANEAIEQYVQSKSLLQSLSKADFNPVAQRDLARTLINLGRMHRMRKEYPAAESSYSAAIDHLQELLLANPDDRRLQFLLAVTERNLGFMLSENLQQRDDAQVWLERSRSIFEQLPTEVPEYQLNHVICLVNLTSFHGRRGGPNGLQKAREYFERSLRSMRLLQRELPGNAEYQSWLGLILGNGAAIAKADGDIELAKKRIDEAIEHQEQAKASQPLNVEYDQRLASHQQFRDLLAKDR